MCQIFQEVIYVIKNINMYPINQNTSIHSL